MKTQTLARRDAIHRDRRAGRSGRCLCGLALLVALAWPMPAGAVTDLHLGDPAPPVVLNDLAGHKVDIHQMPNRPIVLLFGELYHDKTIQAEHLIRRVLQRQSFRDTAIVAYLIVTQDKPATELTKLAAKAGVTTTVLHDPTRKTYEAYRVAVMPSMVVLDRHGRVVHAQAALTDRFEDILTDSLLLALGRITPGQFALRMNPHKAEAENPQMIRARRLTQLAEQLVQRELIELAEDKFNEALAVKPDYVPARLGLGNLEFRRKRWTQAEAAFRQVLRQHPDSTEASLSLAAIQIQRGGEELKAAESLIQAVLNKDARQPRACYLMGLVREKQGRIDLAAASFKKAAELLLEQAQ